MNSSARNRSNLRRGHRDSSGAIAKFLAAVAGSLLLPSPCEGAAQEPDVSEGGGRGGTEAPEKMSLEELMNVKVVTVTTASKRSEKANAAPGTVFVIDKNDIELRGYSSLKDVLRDVPGMDLSSYFFSELGTQVSVRGVSGNNKIVVLVNGMRVNPPGGEYFPFRSDFSVRQAEQIEIIYGPGSTLYGQDAISAVINVKTKEPPASGKMTLQLGGEVGVNSERELYGSFGKVFDRARNISFSGYVQYHDSNLTRIDKEYPSWWKSALALTNAAARGSGTVPEREDFGLNAFAKLQIGDLVLQSWYRNSRRSSGEGYGFPILAYVSEAVWQDSSWVTELKYQWKISEKATLDSSITWNWYEVDPTSRYVFPDTQSATSWFYNDYKYANEHSLSTEHTLKFDITKSWSALVGVAYSNYDIIAKSTVPGGASGGSHNQTILEAGNFVYYSKAGDPTSRQTVPRVIDAEFDRIGAYVETTWQINPKLKVIAGTRIDKDSRISEPSHTPRGAIVYNITDSLTAKYTYSWAYISPSPYFNATYDRGDILAISNPNLKPETSKTHELNFSYAKPAYNLGLSFYYGEQSDLILVSDGGLSQNIVLNDAYVGVEGTAAQHRTIVHSVNGGTSRNVGMDFYGKAKLAENLSTWFSYSLTSFDESAGGVTLGLKGLSEHNFRLGATWAITPKLFLTPSLVAMSTPKNLSTSALTGETKNPWEINLHLLYKPRGNMEVYADLRNITDNHNATTGFSYGSATPQETFTGVLGLRFTF